MRTRIEPNVQVLRKKEDLSLLIDGDVVRIKIQNNGNLEVGKARYWDVITTNGENDFNFFRRNGPVIEYLSIAEEDISIKNNYLILRRIGARDTFCGSDSDYQFWNKKLAEVGL